MSDSLVLAAILCGVDSERAKKSLVNRTGEETLEAVAPIYWPFLVLPSSDAQRVALFDGTGVWRHSFHHSLLPPLEAIREVLAHPRPAQELGAWVRSLTATLARDGGTETMVVEGCVPVDHPLFGDIITESEFRTEPRSSEAGYLPTRRSVDRFAGSVEEIERSLRRSDTELVELDGIRQALHDVHAASLKQLEVERRHTQFEIGNRLRVSAYSEMDREVEALRHSLHDRVLSEIDRIRGATVGIAGARASAKVADTLAQRAASRGTENGEYRARSKAAADVERTGRRTIAESQQRIETLQTRERQAYQVLADRLTVVEQRVAEDLAAFELVRADLQEAISDMEGALGRQVAQRTAERDTLAGQFVPSLSLHGVKVLWLPIWVAILSGRRGARALVFPPMRVRPGKGVSDSIKTLFGGMVLPLEPRTARFDSALRGTMQRALATDPWLFNVMRGLVGAADATASPEFLQRLSMGLQELRQAGWLTADQERR
ncbi:MAG: hypothetical protein L3K17_10055, partial [Thermoplasmata archaeon]|nr:hypothetical protein [Thermoplasmata archaeon]